MPAIAFAGMAGLPTFLVGARNVCNGVRWTFTLTRAVPELAWALIIVFFLSPGLLLGAVALGLHNYGVVGKLSAEVVENLDPGPARALRAAGASNFQMLAHGILPQALPQFLTYLLSRREVVIRTTVVMGFVGAGGLGRELRRSLSIFHHTEVALIIFWQMVLVIAVDLLSA